jgi:hypothetical protein
MPVSVGGSAIMMTKEQWAKVDERLKKQRHEVKLKCDDYEVTLNLAQISQFKLAIEVFVNGWFRGEWFVTNNLSEEARRFFPSRYINCYSTNEKKFYKTLGRDLMMRMNITDLNARREYKSFCWTSFPALKRHFIANNKNIELIEEDPHV